MVRKGEYERPGKPERAAADRLAPMSPMSTEDEEGAWQTLLQGPAHEAGMFYNQIHDEINTLRSRVDQKLTDLVSGGKNDINSLNEQIRSIKSQASSDSDEDLPAVEVVGSRISSKDSRRGNNKQHTLSKEDDSFGDLRISSSAATEQATNLTRTAGTRQVRKSYMAGLTEQDESSSSDGSGDELDVSKQSSEPKQQLRRRLRPQRQPKNKNAPFSPKDAVAAARQATQDDAVTNARFGRASPPRRRFFPEDQFSRRKSGEEKSSNAASSFGGSAFDDEGREQAERQQRRNPDIPLRRTASEVKRSIRQSPAQNNATGHERVGRVPPDPAPTVSESDSRSHKYSNSDIDGYEIVANMSNRSGVSGLSTPYEIIPSKRGRAYHSKSTGTPHASRADRRSETNVSARGRVSGRSQPPTGGDQFSDPREDLLQASLEYLDESRRSLDRQRRNTAQRSGVSDVSAAKSGSSEISYGSGLKSGDVDLLKASLAYLESNHRSRYGPHKHSERMHDHLHIQGRNRSSSSSNYGQSRTNKPPIVRGEDYYHDYDWADQSYASRSLAAKSANLLSIASSSVTERMEMDSDQISESKDLLTLIEEEVAGDGVVKVEKVANQPLVDPYGDGGRYTGLLVKGKPYGHGSMHYDDGRSYTGEWKNGRWNGKGRTLFVNGDFYVGEYCKDQRHGFGRYEWSDGRVYDGQFKRDRRQGKGTYSWPDGAIYTGDFKDGHRHGQGCYKFKDGSVYTGEFYEGKYHGVGECVWADGRCYRGEWRAGHAHGYGVEMRPDGKIRHDGEWRNDRPIRKIKGEECPVEELERKKKKGFKMPEDERSPRRYRHIHGGSPRPLTYSTPRADPRRYVSSLDP